MKKSSFIIIILLLFTSIAFSQIEIKFKEFPKGKLNGNDLWKFDAKNTGNENLNTIFTLTVVYNDTLLYESSTKSMPISSGENINIDLKFEDPPLKNWYGNIKKGMIIRDNDFLIGNYKICMTAYAVNEKNQPEKNKSYGNTCVNHTVENYENDAVIDIKVKKPENAKLFTTDLWNFTANNKSKSKQHVEVYCKLKFNGQDMFEGTSRPFSLQPVETKDISYKINEAVNSLFLMEKLRDNILKTGEFPPGEYNLCLTIRSEWSKKEFGNNCIDQTVQEEKKDK
ncbi:MAG: hypothetical protein IT280_09560 [Ignavibacteria bacterium]|nr:hypothetical protein [Ignavibacteria bacterium]